MEDKLKQFMTVSDLIEVTVSPDTVPDLQLKMEVLAMVYCGQEADEIWDYINSYDS